MNDERREIIADLARTLESEAEEWVMDEYHAVHSGSGVKLWIASGPGFLHAENPRMKFGMLEKWRLWRSLRIAQANCMHRRLVEEAK